MKDSSHNSQTDYRGQLMSQIKLWPEAQKEHFRKVFEVLLAVQKPIPINLFRELCFDKENCCFELFMSLMGKFLYKTDTERIIVDNNIRLFFENKSDLLSKSLLISQEGGYITLFDYFESYLQTHGWNVWLELQESTSDFQESNKYMGRELWHNEHIAKNTKLENLLYIVRLLPVYVFKIKGREQLLILLEDIVYRYLRDLLPGDKIYKDCLNLFDLLGFELNKFPEDPDQLSEDLWSYLISQLGEAKSKIVIS